MRHETPLHYVPPSMLSLAANSLSSAIAFGPTEPPHRGMVPRGTTPTEGCSSSLADTGLPIHRSAPRTLPESDSAGMGLLRVATGVFPSASSTCGARKCGPAIASAALADRRPPARPAWFGSSDHRMDY